MATTTDIREWARARGLEVSSKGPMPAEVRRQYDEAHPGPLPGMDEYASESAAPGDPDTISEAAPAPPPTVTDPRQAERAPSRPRASTSARGRGIIGKIGGGLGRKAPAAGRKAPAKRLPRVSLANLIEDAWGQMAFAASPLPPMQRLLQAQAPYCGLALEDALAGTVVDRFLQPVARAEDKAKAVGGVMFPPAALMLVLATAPVPQIIEGTDPPQYVYPEPSIQHKSALMTLRWSLMLWSEAGSARLEEYRARAEAAAERGAQADQFMAFILGFEDPGGVDGQAPDATAAAVSAEDEAVRRAQTLFGG